MPGYRRQRTTRSSTSSFVGTVFTLLFISGSFVAAVYWFRTSKPSAPDAPPEAEVMENIEPTSVLFAAASLDRDHPDAVLQGLDGFAGKGTAHRAWKDGRFTLSIETNLVNTSIDRATTAYEVWLIRPVPYDFFSIGDMVSNNIGFFVTDWEGSAGSDVRDYTQVLITKELKDGNPEPGEKLLLGEFGKEE